MIRRQSSVISCTAFPINLCDILGSSFAAWRSNAAPLPLRSATFYSKPHDARRMEITWFLRRSTGRPIGRAFVVNDACEMDTEAEIRGVHTHTHTCVFAHVQRINIGTRVMRSTPLSSASTILSTRFKIVADQSKAQLLADCTNPTWFHSQN